MPTEDPAPYVLGRTDLESGHAFRMRTVQDAFRKMHREKKRFEAADDRRDQVDFAINFATSAWHMTDWVWTIHEATVRELFGMDSPRGLGEFQRLMRLQSKALAACDIIANASKHGGTAYTKEGRPDFETILVAHAVPGEHDVVQLVAAMANREWSLLIMIDGKPHHPRVLFNEVFQLWHKFIQQHCISNER